MTSIIIYLGRQSRVNLVQALFALMKPELLSGKIPVAFFYVGSKPDLALNALSLLLEKHSAFFNLCLVGSFTLIFCCHARLRGYITMTHEQRGRLL